MNIIFEIKVFLDEIFEVSNEFNKIIMINFHGDCTCDFFEGKILPGAVDELLTTPFIVTDNNNLKWLEEKQLVGKIQQVDDCLKIVFYEGLNTK